jgi:hypothetical protein
LRFFVLLLYNAVVLHNFSIRGSFTLGTDLPEKVIAQIEKAGLPTGGQHPFEPKLGKNQKGESIIAKATVQQGPRKGKKGYVDKLGRIWIRDRAHAGVPEHWDVQENGGASYIRVDGNGNEVS